MISVEATGVLSVCVYQDVTPSSPALVRRFKGVKRQGEDYFQRILRELREVGFVGIKRETIGNDIRTVCWVTDDGKRYLLGLGFPLPQGEFTTTGNSTPLFQQSELISTNSLNSLTSKEYTRTGSGVPDSQELQMGYDFFSSTSSSDKDEQVAEAIKREAAKKVEYQAKKEASVQKRLVSRKEKPPIAWTVSDVAYEFGDRLLKYWHIKPWVIKQTRFIYALADHRRRYDTNGEMEVKMLDLFFSSMDFQQYSDPEYLARIFLNRFPQLAQQAGGMVRTEDEIQESDTQAKKSQEWLLGDDE